MTGCITGVVIMTTHFVISSFLLTFYNTNQKLTYALKEADESKTELKAAYEQLSEKAVYEERNRIARDIHDNAGHSMTAVIMQTEAAKVLIDTNPEEAKVRIISANLQAKNALDQMRESVHLLAGRSQVVSVKEELEEIIAQSMDGTDVKIRSDIIDVDLPADRRRFVCNCLKECLSNGIRHGGASAFYVELKRDEKQVTLIVSDNGSGLEPDFKEGYGIRGMREKAATYGGDISYESEQGEGVEVSIRVELV
jgi:signal transduction histidine kinase